MGLRQRLYDSPSKCQAKILLVKAAKNSTTVTDKHEIANTSPWFVYHDITEFSNLILLHNIPSVSLYFSSLLK